MLANQTPKCVIKSDTPHPTPSATSTTEHVPHVVNQNDGQHLRRCRLRRHNAAPEPGPN